MAAGTDIVASIVDGIAGLGVPWWGWTALVVMIFWGLLGPGQQPTAEELEAELARDRLRG